MDRPHLLLAESDPEIQKLLERTLTMSGYQVTSVSSTGGLFEHLAQAHLLILAWGLDGGGKEALKVLRRGATESRKLPVIVLSDRDSEVERVIAFEIGADDFVGKPFSVRELKLRIRALLRRSRIGGCRLLYDAELHRVWLDARPLELSEVESRLLFALLERAEEAVPREELARCVRPSRPLEPRSIDTYIARLRRKLGSFGRALSTERGVGYRFRGHALNLSDPSVFPTLA